MSFINERNQDATLYVGGLDDQCTEAILWELFTQAGPIVNVHMPKDRITGSHQGYGFVEFVSEKDADYAMKVMNMVKLYGKPLRANKASANQKNQDIGANIFIGNLDPDVDEKLLYDTFSAFGQILHAPKIMRNNISRCYAFINYASFEASDAAIESMNGQHFSNRPITVSYAFKKDGKGERHGSMVERLLVYSVTILAFMCLFAHVVEATTHNETNEIQHVTCGTIASNVTNILVKNPHHPRATFVSEICETVVQRSNSSIKTLKINFKQLELYRPTYDGICIHDRFAVYNDLNAALSPIMCGNLTGQSISIPFKEPQKSVIISVTTSDLDHDRLWELQIEQLK